MAVGSIISAARYNAIQASVDLVLGIGSGTYGYGQTLNSSLVPIGEEVTATDMEELKQDIINAGVHQTGAVPSLTSVVTSDDITDAVYVEYETEGGVVFANVNDVFEATQTTAESKLSSTRTTSWGGAIQPQTIQHEFTVTFTNGDARRHFFNSGGEVRFSASLTGTTGSKSAGWAGMLSSIGVVKFSYDDTTASSGSTFSLGNYDLTSINQDILLKTGSGIYSDSFYKIEARELSSSIIVFTVSFYDGESSYVDESVNGTLTSSIAQLRATGAFVEVPSPNYANTVLLTDV